ncbi:TonB-dependent receptor [Echinicola sediminis]
MKFTQISLFFFSAMLVTFLQGRAQQLLLIKGVVSDAETSEKLSGAAVYWEGRENEGVISDLKGEFWLEVEKLPVNLVVSFIGYEKKIIQLSNPSIGDPLEIQLQATAQSLAEVVIEGGREMSIVESVAMGKSKLDMGTLSNIPSLFGEVDVLRSLQLLPGIQNAGEGSTGLFVRGGSSDQNLVQLDGAPVYNPSHFFGFFSVFNPDAIEEVELYKGNIPATLGGRLSSVVDLKMKEGNTERLRGKGGIGTISSKLALDGPLFSENSSFMLSGRRTYADMFLKLSNNEDIKNNKLHFFDLGAKLTFRLSEDDKLSLSSYNGQDYLRAGDLFGFGWKNWINTVVWNKTLGEQAHLDLNGYYSRYSYLIHIMDEENGFKWNNLISEGGLRGVLGLRPLDNTLLEMGFHSRVYHFFPVDMEADPGSKVEPVNTHPKNALQNDVFISAEIDLNQRLKLETGLRWSLYHQVGRGVRYIYEQEPTDQPEGIVDTVYYDRLKSIKFYNGLEPRLALRYRISDHLSFKTAFNRNFQYLQVASNNSAGLPIDRWGLANHDLPPVRVDHFSAGLYKLLKEGTWEASIEGYYKDYKDIIDVRPGGDVLFTDNIEAQVLLGDAWAFGGEFHLKKKKGKTTGWLGYTYSRTFRKVQGISEGEAYNPRYDRPHDISLVLHHEFNERLSCNLTFVYATGQAVSFPIGAYHVDNQEIPLYGPKRNKDRFPDYHRADASVTIKSKDKGKNWRSSWNFSIYNLYGRKNPYSYQFIDIVNNDINYDSSSGEPVYSRRPGVIKTYLFSFLPSISYAFEF